MKLRQYICNPEFWPVIYQVQTDESLLSTTDVKYSWLLNSSGLRGIHLPHSQKSTFQNSTNYRSCNTAVCIYWKKNLCISGLAQFTHVTIISILQIAKWKSHYIFAQFYTAGTYKTWTQTKVPSLQSFVHSIL